MRFLILPEVLEMIRLHMPWGSGIGSFQAVYAIHEPNELLRGFYMNHAHNDWLEVVMTGGLPAALILAVALGGIAMRVPRLLRGVAGDGEATLMGRLGLAVLMFFALASITDYPLRTPALLCFAVVAVLWTGAGSRPLRQTVDSLD
jgi:O-antigen ligase